MFNRSEPKKKSKVLLGTGLILGLLGITTATALLHPKGKNALKQLTQLRANDLGKKWQDLHLPRNLNELYQLKEPKKQIDAKYLIAGGLLSGLIAAGTALLASGQTGRNLKRQLKQGYQEAEKSFSQNGTHAKGSRKKKSSPASAAARKPVRHIARLAAE